MHVFFTVSFCLQCAGDDFLTCYLCLQGIFYLQCFLFVKAVSPVGHRIFDVLFVFARNFLFAVFSLCESGVPCGPPYF